MERKKDKEDSGMKKEQDERIKADQAVEEAN